MSEEIDNRPKSPFEAAIDAATGYKPVDEDRVVSDAEQDGQDGGAEAAEVGSADETKAVDEKERHDWVEEAYECFIKNAVDLEPTDPVGAIKAYFEKNATYELKAKSVAEGKTYESCWKFIEAVARKALGSRTGHIDPVAVYAIAMHYFQDVPKDWNEKKEKVKAKSENAWSKKKSGKPSAALPSGVKKTKKIEELERKIAQPVSAKHAQELKAKLKSEKERIKEKEKKHKAKKRGGEQGFFFDLMETEAVGPDVGQQAYDIKGGRQADDSKDGKEAGDAK